MSVYRLAINNLERMCKSYSPKAIKEIFLFRNATKMQPSHTRKSVFFLLPTLSYHELRRSCAKKLDRQSFFVLWFGCCRRCLLQRITSSIGDDLIVISLKNYKIVLLFNAILRTEFIMIENLQSSPPLCV